MNFTILMYKCENVILKSKFCLIWFCFLTKEIFSSATESLLFSNNSMSFRVISHALQIAFPKQYQNMNLWNKTIHVIFENQFTSARDIMNDQCNILHIRYFLFCISCALHYLMWHDAHGANICSHFFQMFYVLRWNETWSVRSRCKT